MTPLEIGLQDIKDKGFEDWSMTAELALQHIRSLSAEVTRWRDAYHKLYDGAPVEVRMPDGFLDEIVGYGGFHVEHLDKNHWFFDLGGCKFNVHGFDIRLQPIETDCWDNERERVSEDQALADTVKERIADPKIVDVNLEDLVSTEQKPQTLDESVRGQINRGLYPEQTDVCPKTAIQKDSTQNGNIQEPDVNVCPGCGGYADNGFSRSVPPDPYYCTKCEPVGDRQ